MNDEEHLSHWVGIDAKKQGFTAAVDFCIDGEEAEVWQLPCENFANSADGVADFLQWIAGIIPRQPFKVVMKNSGYYSISLGKLLQAQKKDLACCAANSNQTANFVKSMTLLHETGFTDAQILARFGTECNPQPIIFRGDDEERLQDISRYHEFLAEMKIECEKRGKFLVSKDVRQCNEEIVEVLQKDIIHYENEMRLLAQNSEWIKKQVELMQTIPGVTEIAAFAFTAELGNLKNYTVSGISATTGLAPMSHKSGSLATSSRGQRGKAVRLRRLLYISSSRSIQSIPSLRDFYFRLTSKGKSRLEAKCACMRKLMILIRGVVVNERPYSQAFSYQTLERMT